jgi:hypothetical protein
MQGIALVGRREGSGGVYGPYSVVERYVPMQPDQGGVGMSVQAVLSHILCIPPLPNGNQQYD